jgi:hypothetical protein
MLRTGLFGGAVWYNQHGEISMAWLWSLFAVAGWVTLMRWILPRFGVKT